MKKAILLLTTSAFSYIALTGYSTGLVNSPFPQNRTGAGGSSGSCDGTSCHPANNTNLNLSISLYDLVAGAQVTNGKYKPNAPYQIRIAGTIGISANFSSFSYQLTTASQGMDYGSFFSNPGLQAGVIAPYEIIEPFQPIPSTSGTAFRDTINWLAPDPGNDDVTVYLTMMASNSDGSINGDWTNNDFSIYQEQTTSVADLDSRIKTLLYPNPVKDALHLSIEGAEKGEYTIAAYSTTGQIAEKRTVNISSGEAKLSINTTSWAAGSYFLMIRQGEAQRVIKFVKN